MNYKNIFNEIIDEFFGKIGIQNDKILVFGCSTSEISGGTIGKNSNFEIGMQLTDLLINKCKEKDVHLAVQCCEHLNRALVVERKVAEKYKLEQVMVTPYRSAGGSIGEAAYKLFDDPVMVEFIKADYGIDIGSTFIGMHIKHVLIPVRLSVKKIGEANITFATSRPKYIGGPRAIYEK